MKISIIDIGTQSLKHYIFEVDGFSKKLIHYKRYSDANLGESDPLGKEAMDRTIKILQECLLANKSLKVDKLDILGTEILRKANNAHEFVSAVKVLSGHEIGIISHDLEAQYLYEGFVNIVPENFMFAAMNIGGGSTEVVIGDKTSLSVSKKIPFGVKFLRKSFSKDNVIDWDAVDNYLDKNINFEHKVENAFVTGVLDFISTVGPHLGFKFEENNIPNHPIKFTLDSYVSFLEILRNTSVERLKELYPKDPGFGENFAIGQSVYAATARKLEAKNIIPSNNDLTDGVIYNILKWYF